MQCNISQSVMCNAECVDCKLLEAEQAAGKYIYKNASTNQEVVILSSLLLILPLSRATISYKLKAIYRLEKAFKTDKLDYSS